MSGAPLSVIRDPQRPDMCVAGGGRGPAEETLARGVLEMKEQDLGWMELGQLPRSALPLYG